LHTETWSQACAEARTAEFPRLGAAAYLNAASFTPLPERALAAMRAFEERRSAGMLTPDDFAPALARVRAACARLIDADDAEIALTPNTSVGLNIAAAILRQRSAGRRTIIMPDREFPANVYSWLALEREGYLVELLPVDDAGCPREDVLLQRMARGDVCALTISAVQFATGYRADLETLGAACAEHDVLFVVDAIQALGVAPISVRNARIDVLACGGQKWLCGPFGTGFTYIRRDLCTSTEPDLPGWLSFESTADFTSLLHYNWDLWPDARRFEVGSLGIQSFVGLAHSVELILEIGVEHIEQHVSALHEPLLAWAAASAVASPVVTEQHRRAGILALRLPDADALNHALAAAGVTVVPREGSVRFAPHFYNTASDVERALTVLRRLE
jgi:cysteine desulfurase / selenocysteine lyase